MVKGENEKYYFKVVFVGDKGVGKTSLLVSSIAEKFLVRLAPPSIGGNPYIGEDDERMVPINGSFRGDFDTKTVLLEQTSITLQFWNDARMIDSKSPLSSYFLVGASAYLVCYDQHDYESFVAVSHWIQKLHENSDQKVPVVLVGCKGDLPALIPKKEIQDLITANDIKIHEVTSAKTQSHVQSLMKKIAHLCLDTYQAKKNKVRK